MSDVEFHGATPYTDEQKKALAGLLTSKGQARNLTRTMALRSVRATDVEESSDGLRIKGYAAVFNSDSERMFGCIVEQIAPGSFKDVLAENPDVRFQAQHDHNALARTTNGTLRLWEDETGLAFEADLNPDVQAARDLYALIQRGDITQMSFGFEIGAQVEEFSDDPADDIRVTITRVKKLYEISAVTFPAYPAASVAARDASNDAECASGEGVACATRTRITTWSRRWSTYGSDARS